MTGQYAPRRNGEFDLQFDRSLIRELSSRYSYALDEAPFEAGRAIASGDAAEVHLWTIVRWKSPRSITKVRRNSAAEVAKALTAGGQGQTDGAAVRALVALYGVGVPIASAILTVIDPSRYTIIDVRALEALGVHATYPNVDFYLRYVACCRELAAESGVDLRTLDRAMWQWSKEQAGSIGSRAGKVTLRATQRGSVKEEILRLGHQGLRRAEISRRIGTPTATSMPR